MNADVEKAVERIDFTVSDGSPRILTWRDGNGCRPATEAECALWDALRDQDAEIARLRGAADLIPTSWLDPLLTGQDAVIGAQPYDGRDIENLLRALRERITAHLGGEHE